MPNGDRNRRQDSGHVPFRIGPGLLVTAAFIGPGTVVTASKAGAERGCGLLWTIVFACIGTIVLQSLAARVGIASGNGLGESIRKTLDGSRWLRPAILLVIAAIGIGNAAYQTGNLTGAAAGIRVIAGGSAEFWIATLVACTCSLLLIGRYRVLHASLVAMVVLLSLAFLCTAALSLPAATRIATGIAIPRFGVEDLTLVLALIGTTIVPYNLFLHASSAASTWKGEPMRESIIQSDWDTTISVGLGGVVTASILITASTAFFDTRTPWTSVGEIGQQLKPTLGSASATAFAIGLFAAGLTSSITAPLATAYAVCGCLGWSTDPSGRHFRAISLGIVVCGGAFALAMGKSPTATIIFAQLANGMLLPFIAVFLLMAVTGNVNRPNLMLGKVRLRLAQLVLAAVVLLSMWRIAAVFA